MIRQLKKYKVAFFILLIVGLLAALALYLKEYDVAVLNPKGIVAAKERDLMVTAMLLMMIIVVPVFLMTFFITWKYREGNKKAKKYSPDWDHNRIVEFTWWAIPSAIILVLAVITWRSSHELDPYKQLEVSKKPITVQVVALQWKWLFIYPELGIASVNFVQFPEDTPVNFEITADAPMNSFWIPQLGGQVYAMAGMKTKLHLIADETGSYSGSSANISGRGFSGMRFTARASSQADYDDWVQSVKDSSDHLTMDEYNRLSKPSTNNPVAYFSSTASGLLDKVVMKFMMPTPEGGGAYEGEPNNDDTGHH